MAPGERTHFRYTPEQPQQNVFQLALVVAYLVWLEVHGPAFWEQALQHFTLRQIWVCCGFAIYFFWFWLWSLPFLFLDHWQRPAWLYRYKVQTPGTILPWRRLVYTVIVVLGNQFFGTLPALALLYHTLTAVLGMPETGVAVPRWYVALGSLVLSVVMEEILFYFVHRAMHTKHLYRFHKMHHDFKESIAPVTHYVHYVEHLILNLFPIFTGTLLIGKHAHILSLILWILLAVQNAVVTHSGYNFPWFSWLVVPHDFHHYNYVGNYGVGLGMDWLCGTDVLEKTLGREYHDNLAKRGE